MYVDDPNWKGPRCHVCNAPVKDDTQIADARAAVASVEKQLGKRPGTLPIQFFCSDACLRGKLGLS